MDRRRIPYIYGAEAPKIEYKTYEGSKVLKYEKKKRAVKKQKSKLVYIILMLFILGAGVIFRYSQITGINYEIGISRMELSGLVKENEDIKAEIEKKTDIEMIRDVAINKLNMRLPYKHQIEYVRIDKKDYSVQVNEYKTPKLPDAGGITLLIKNIGKAINIFK